MKHRIKTALICSDEGRVAVFWDRLTGSLGIQLPVLCRYLASHRYYPKDSKYEGMVRLMVHADPAKAVIWEFVTVDGKQYLKVKENRDYTAPDTAGWYVAVPPDSDRDQHSKYLAITPDLDKAMAVEVLAVDSAAL